MGNNDETIRSKAVRQLKKQQPAEIVDWQNDPAKVIEELQIHQIELEMQNEELRNAQLKLQSAQQKYLELYNFAPVGYITFDANGLILELNFTAARLLGVPRQQLVGRTMTPYLAQISTMDFYQHCHVTLGRADASAPVTCELTLSDSTDPPRVIALESAPVFNDAGAPFQIRSAMIDITQQKLTENRLRASEAKWAALVNNTSDLIWAIDRKYAIIRANDALRAIVKKNMGYRLEADSDMFRIIPPGLDGVWRDALGQAFSGKNQVLELEMWDEFFEVSLNPFNARKGVVTGVVVYAHSISERKAMETILRDRNRELDSFAHKIAHELNSPLNMLTGYADYLLKYAAGGDAEELQRLGNKIGDTAQQAAKIIDELLFLADSSRKKFVPTPLNMLEILQRVCQRLTAVIDDAGAEITLSDSLPSALGYAPWVEKVCLNLLSIALATAPSPKKILISGQKEPADGLAHFWVLTGETGATPGKPAVASGSVQPVTSNYGVELTVIEQVMRRMDGAVSIAPGANCGLVLHFTLPATSFSEVLSP